MNIRPLLIFLTLFVLSCQLAAAQTVTISGHVKDSSSGEPLAGAHIYPRTGRYGTTTDAEGTFNLALPKGRTVQLVISYVGYETLYKSIEATQDTDLELQLNSSNSLPGVEVYGARHDFGVESSQMGAVELPVEQVRSMPTLFGETDILKTIQKLPGIQPASDGNAGIRVRGGEYDQNLITIDGAPLYNAEHLKGYISAVSPDIVGDIVLYKGAFPARYGSRLSSVVDIGLKEGDFNKYHGQIGIGMLSSRLQAEGPIWKGRTSFNIAARASYFNWIVEPMLKKIYDNEDALAEYSHMNYYDITAKVVHRLTNKDKLSASFYYGKDVNNEAPQTSSGNSSRSIQEEKYILSTRRVHSNTADNNWNNIVGGLTWNHFFNKGSAMYTRLNFSRYKYDMDYTAHTEETTERIYFAIKNDDNKLLNQQTITDPKTSYSSGITDLSLSSGLNTRIHDKHDLKAGIDLSYKKVSPSIDAYRYVYTKKLRGITSPLTDPLYDETEEIKQSKTDDGRDLYTASAYAEDDIDWNRYIKTNIGVRASYYGVDGKSYIYIEPRLSLRFLLREGMSVKLGYARMTQGIHQLASSNITSPSDIWVSATKNIAPSTADQLSVGYEYELPHDISLSVEGYYKKMDDLLDYMDGSSFINSNGKWENLVAVGKGKSYGVEFLLQKMTGMTTGWISYTYQRSLRTFDKPGMELNGGKEFKATSRTTSTSC